MRRSASKWCFLAALLALLLLSGCRKPGTLFNSLSRNTPDPDAELKSTIYVDSMDTFMELSAYGSNRDEALKAAKAEIERLNDRLSIGLDSSEISRINRRGNGVASSETVELVSEALTLYTQTGGAFDLTVYPLMELWGFVSKDYHVPTEQELADTLKRVGADRIALDVTTGSISLGEGQAIDLGGIAKGYTSQRLMKIFRDAGVSSAIVSLGGNIQCLGTKPDGSAWRIGVKDPFHPDTNLAAVVQVVDKAVITSGGYERYFVDEETGTVYRHIIDPSTGYPADSGLSSVTIVTANGMLGDGLSTALYIMGLDRAADFWREHSGEFEAILIDNEGEIYVTAGLEGDVTSSRELHVIQEN